MSLMRVHGYIEVKARNIVRVATTIDQVDAAGVFWRNNTGAVSSTHKGRQSFTRFGIPGMPDIWVLKVGGSLVGVECKAESGRQSDAQKRWETVMSAMNAKYVLARSGDDLAGVLW